MRNTPAPKFHKELFNGIKYDFDNGPMITSPEEIFDSGINCQLFIHIALEELGLSLPKWMRSSEIYEDDRFLESIYSGSVKTKELDNFDFSRLRAGDIFIFNRKLDGTPISMHTAVLVGFDDDGQPLIAQAVQFLNRKKDAVIVRKFKYITAYKNCTYIHGVKRVRSNPQPLTQEEETMMYEKFLPTTTVVSQEECSDADREEFKQFIRNAAQLEPGGVSTGSMNKLVIKAPFLVFSRDDSGKLVGARALKKPYNSYKRKVFNKAGTKEDHQQEWLELGWLYVDPKWRNTGIATSMTRVVLAKVSQEQRVFATTRDTNVTARHILISNGFKQSGNEYPSVKGEYNIILYTLI